MKEVKVVLLVKDEYPNSVQVYKDDIMLKLFGSKFGSFIASGYSQKDAIKNAKLALFGKDHILAKLVLRDD
jgi:hypothetical protein